MNVNVSPEKIILSPGEFGETPGTLFLKKGIAGFQCYAIQNISK